MKITRYAMMLAAATGLLSACQKLDEVKAYDPDKVVAPVLHALPGEIVITPDNMGSTQTFTWDAADFGVRTQILWDKAGNELASGSLSGKIDMQMLTAAISVEAQADDDGSLLNLYRTFARLRNTYPVLAQGKMVKHPVYNDGNTSQQSIAAWYRELDGERMLVVHNFGQETQILTLTDQPDKAVGVSGEVKLQRGDASSKLLMGAWSSVVFTL